MQDIWIESFYNEIDAEKRQAFLYSYSKVERITGTTGIRASDE